jgi:hypothetical protein
MLEPSATHELGVHERCLNASMLGVGMIVFPIDVSTPNLIVPWIMTNLRVYVYQIQDDRSASGRRWSIDNDH